MPSEASSPPLWGGGPRGHSRSSALCGAQQLLVNGAARLLWVSYPRWVQLLLLRYSFSSGFKSKGRLGDWGGGKFPNKQPSREGLSWARQYEEQDVKVPCARRGCRPPHPTGTGTWPQGSREQSWAPGGGFAAPQNPFPSHGGLAAPSRASSKKQMEAQPCAQGTRVLPRKAMLAACSLCLPGPGACCTSRHTAVGSRGDVTVRLEPCVAWSGCWALTRGGGLPGGTSWAREVVPAQHNQFSPTSARAGRSSEQWKVTERGLKKGQGRQGDF